MATPTIAVSASTSLEIGAAALAQARVINFTFQWHEAAISTGSAQTTGSKLKIRKFMFYKMRKSEFASKPVLRAFVRYRAGAAKFSMLLLDYYLRDTINVPRDFNSRPGTESDRWNRSSGVVS